MGFGEQTLESDRLGVRPDSTHTGSMNKIIETTPDSLSLGIYFKFRSS